MWSSDPTPLNRRQFWAWPLAGAAVLGVPAGLAGQAGRVQVWVSDTGGAQGEVIGHLRNLWGAQVQLEVQPVPPLPALPGEARLHLTLGVRPLAELAAQVQRQPGAWTAPVLAALLPEAAYVLLARSLPAGSSGVWLDQPPERYLSLIQQVMPRRRRVGVLFGPATAALEPALDRAASDRQLVLVKSRVQEDTPNLFPLLRNLLADSDVLLALPDPSIYNAATLQNILIATYRQRIPVVSYAESHVRAGATLSLFTTPQVVARQVVAASRTLWLAGALPAPMYAASGTVAVNEQVARSLGLDVPNPEALQRMLAGEFR